METEGQKPDRSETLVTGVECVLDHGWRLLSVDQFYSTVSLNYSGYPFSLSKKSLVKDRALKVMTLPNSFLFLGDFWVQNLGTTIPYHKCLAASVLQQFLLGQRDKQVLNLPGSSMVVVQP